MVPPFPLLSSGGLCALPPPKPITQARRARRTRPPPSTPPPWPAWTPAFVLLFPVASPPFPVLFFFRSYFFLQRHFLIFLLCVLATLFFFTGPLPRARRTPFRSSTFAPANLLYFSFPHLLFLFLPPCLKAVPSVGPRVWLTPRYSPFPHLFGFAMFLPPCLIADSPRPFFTGRHKGPFW